MWQVHRHGVDDASPASFSNSLRSHKSPVNVDVFNSLLESYEAKKKCAYMLLILCVTSNWTTTDIMYQPHPRFFQ